MKTNITLLAVTEALSFATVPTYGQLVPIVGIDILSVGTVPAVPPTLNNRGDEDAVIDGNLNSFSYLTPSGTNGPQFVAFDIGTAVDINRLRVSKFSDLAGVGQPQDTADLQILFTTDSGPLIDRNYIPVSGLASGYLGTEFIDALSVNSADATVEGDNHDRFLDATEFYSLSFDTASATGMAIRFEKGPSSSNPFTHYRVYEAQVLDGTTPRSILDVEVFSAAVPEVINPPNPRGDEALAIDGDENTFSYLTPGGTDGPQMAALDFGTSALIRRLRVKKLANIDGTGDPVDNMDLQILFTTDTGPMNERTYLPVSGLTNGGLGGVEPIDADSVNAADATVDNDRNEGWYTLSFDDVDATGLAVQFARDGGDAVSFTHYPVFEFQVEAVPEPSSAILMVVGLVSMSLGGRRRRNRFSGK